MSAKLLLDHFDRLAEATDAIPRLRQFILDLAVRGRLANPSIFPALRVPLNTVASLQNGYAFKSEWFVRKGIRLVRNTNVSHDVLRWEDTACLSEDRAVEFERFRLDEGDIVLSLDRPFIATGTKVARVSRADLPSLLLQRVGRFIIDSKQLSAEYLFRWLHSSDFSSQVDPGRSNGVPHVSSKQIEATQLFVPPLAEQHCIVAKVDELMALCDRLEAAQSERERRRDRLVAASLHRLNTAPDPAAFDAAARFHLRHLPRLTDRQDQIQTLREAIINLAVRGKLLPQDPSDEPASKLLERLRVQRAKLFSSAKLVEERGEADAQDEPLFELPTPWVWVHTRELASRISDGVHKKPHYLPTGVPFLTVKNLTDGPSISFRETKFISASDHAEFVKRTNPERGDVLITKDGTIGVARVIETDRVFSIFVSVALVKMLAVEIGPFFALCVNSSLIRSSIVPKGAALKHLHLVDLRRLRVPLPPVAEQRRIVAKVGELMALCDEMEAALQRRAAAGEALLNSASSAAVSCAD